MVVSEPFEATDANGINVTGTVDVGRERDGDFFNPASPHYKQPRFSNYRFQYFNTRDACKIDPETLKAAMEQALENALMRFGIKEPDRGTIRKDVHNSVEATRQQCAKNVDKFVSNETFSAADWETGKAVGPVTARAYAAVSTPDGGVRKVVVRENTWPADFPAPATTPPWLRLNCRMPEETRAMLTASRCDICRAVSREEPIRLSLTKVRRHFRLFRPMGNSSPSVQLRLTIALRIGPTLAAERRRAIHTGLCHLQRRAGRAALSVESRCRGIPFHHLSSARRSRQCLTMKTG